MNLALSVDEIKRDFETQYSAVKNMQHLNELRIAFMGKKGLLAQSVSALVGMSIEDRRSFGAAINSLRDFIGESLSVKQRFFEEEMLLQKLNSESIDITLPGRDFKRGKVHPITHVINDIKRIFSGIGFEHVEGPDIEDNWHNFNALNIPEMHPARQMHDTFYLADIERLLRTHTSSVEIRYMQQHQPPFKIISTGRVYRSDCDATHTPMFHQLEGLCVGADINFAHMKSFIAYFLKRFFAVEEVPMRLRPSYFPFTEPSAEIDIQCDRSDKSEIKIGCGSDWLEILGCGMLHNHVLRNVGIDPDQYQGFAFGIGIERLVMLKYNISDLRLFFEGDMRWNEHYGF